MHRPSDGDVNWMSPVQGESPTLQVKELYGNLDMVTCRLSPCHPESTPADNTQECLAVYRERKGMLYQQCTCTSSQHFKVFLLALWSFDY